MIYFLQSNIVSKELLDFISKNSFVIETYFLIFVIILQLYVFVRVLKDISIFKGVFKNSLFEKKVTFDKLKLEIIDDESQDAEDIKENRSSSIGGNNGNIIKISITEAFGNNEIMIRIKNMINNYIINNYGAAVNFSILKDIMDREVDAKDEEISQSIPTPLYLGLAATMLGIIFGLASMPDINVKGTNFILGINSLIKGVKFAMGASLFGLFLTTLLSTRFYKRAKSKILKEKNDQLSYLQAKLLPELIKAEDTGISGLKHSLDKFSREATKIVHNVKLAAMNTGTNIAGQQKVLNRIEKINMTKVSKFNLELFGKLDANMDTFNKFSEYLSTMKEISINLKDFANRTVVIDRVVDQIYSSTEDSKKLTKFLASHFEKIESSGEQARNAVNFADAHFRGSIENLEKEINERVSKMNETASLHDSHLREIYEEIGVTLKKLTAEHIKEFTNSYEGAVPDFKQLNHLEELAPIKETIENKVDILKKEVNSNNELLVESIIELNKTIGQLTKDFNNISLSKKLINIENRLKNKTYKIKNNSMPSNVSPKSSIIKRMTNFFRFKKNGPVKKVKEETINKIKSS